MVSLRFEWGFAYLQMAWLEFWGDCLSLNPNFDKLILQVGDEAQIEQVEEDLEKPVLERDEEDWVPKHRD